MILPQLNGIFSQSTLLSTSDDTVARTRLISHACLLCALHRGCMGRVEWVVDTRIVTSLGLLDEIRQLQNRLKVQSLELQLPHQL